MKAILLTLLLGTSLVSLAQYKPLPFKTDTIAIAKAKDHVGIYRTICGAVSSITVSTTSIEDAYLITVANEGQMTLVVWHSDAAKWDPSLEDWLKVDDRICVQGQITSYGGQPRMEIGNQGQIHK